MKNKNFFSWSLFLIIYGLCTVPLVAQLNPSRKQAVVTFIWTNPLEQKAWNKKTFEIEQKTTQRRWRITTDAEGRAAMLLPIGQDYILHVTDWENFAEINIPNEPFSRHRIPVPCYDLANLPKGSITIPVHIQLVDSLGLINALEKEVLLLRNNCGKEPYQVRTNKDGRATLTLPIGCQYILSLRDAPNYYKFELPNKPYSSWTETVLFERLPGRSLYPSTNRALFNFIFTDLDGNEVEGEQFWMLDTENGKRYEASTNALGIAQILVPLSRTYTLHATHNRHFAKYTANLAPDKDILVEHIYYESISSKTWQKRLKTQESLARTRDSIARAQALLMAMQDSIQQEKSEEAWIANLLANKRPIPIKRTLRIRKAIRAKTRFVEQQLRLNPNYAKESKQPILAVLQRHAALWKGKVVVTDVTESMRPYLDQVLIWHQLRLQKGEPISYVFFNDGDKKMASAKVIGKTGGIYTCKGTWQQMDTILQVMHKAMGCGLGGGEPPENDLEAVLAGVQQRSDVQELILIADSYSRVRDMDLLHQVKVPVRIILCGAEEQNSFYPTLKPDINEEYLTIAHRTKGSIHTLQQDILNLSETQEGEIVEIGEHRYLLSNRQFIKLEP
ncbi:MAG: collagen binding domain-containing protein [Aureispira sp.]